MSTFPSLIRVVQKKTPERDGYTALQLGYGELKPARATKALAGHFAKAKVAPKRYLQECRVTDAEAAEREAKEREEARQRELAQLLLQVRRQRSGELDHRPLVHLGDRAGCRAARVDDAGDDVVRPPVGQIGRQVGGGEEGGSLLAGLDVPDLLLGGLADPVVGLEHDRPCEVLLPVLERLRIKMDAARDG